MATTDQLLALLGQQDERVRRAFIEFVKSVQSPEVMDELIARLEANDLDGALRILDSYVARFANVIPEVMSAVGIAAAEELDRALPDIALAIAFDPTNPRAAAIAAETRMGLIRGLTAQQEAAARQAISRAIANGAGAREIARAFRDSVGLTASQEAYVNTYRLQLERLDARALDRALRDQRFDQRLETAIERDRQLTARQIDAMVERYRLRAIASRAETIARTESLTAYSLARDEALRQMMEQTRINSSRVLRVWHATHDDRVRLWHLDMEGQTAQLDEPFIDGLGNAVRFPGDPLAAPETRINCRCTLGFEVQPIA